jgi:hypothetical protein
MLTKPHMTMIITSVTLTLALLFAIIPLEQTTFKTKVLKLTSLEQMTLEQMSLNKYLEQMCLKQKS